MGRSVGRRLVYDIETDGLLEDSKPGAKKTYRKLTKVHCIGAIDADTEEEFLFGPDRLDEGLRLLAEADELIGHNVIQFDLKALQLLYPEFHPKDPVQFDTLIAAKLTWPGDVLFQLDGKLVEKGILPPQLRKRYSLKSFGYRMGFLKGEFAEETDWQEYTPEMGEYCLQDCRVELALYRRIMAKAAERDVPPEVFKLEMLACEVLFWQEKAGFWFDYDKALSILADLQNRQAALEERLKEQFPPWLSPVWVERKDPRTGEVLKDQRGRALLEIKTETVKTTRKVKMTEYPDVTIRRFSPKTGKELKPYVGPPLCHYEEGSPYSPIEFLEFNPSSRDHVADRLEKIFGWDPQEFSPKDGRPKVDETILKSLPYPPAGDLVNYFIVSKIAGMLAQGAQSWIVNYDAKTHRIHGRVDQLGTITGRAAHSNPNLGQVPSIAVGPDGHPLMGLEGAFGYECRSLFGAPPGWEQTGVDMAGIELRCLAHYMAPFDGGDYIKLVTEGDVHTANQQAAGLPTRASAKTMIYAFLYGAGDVKMGTIVMEAHGQSGWPEKKLRAEGKKLKANLLRNLPALGTLIEKVKQSARKGWIRGLDGRVLYVRSEYSALNTLLQACGAILAKRWMVNTHIALPANGIILGRDYQQMAWVHDELQLGHRPGLGPEIGRIAVEQIAEAGRQMNFRCPITGEAKHGRNWADTH